MDSFHDALRRRLQTIQATGEDQTTWARLQAQRKAERNQLQAGIDRLSAINAAYSQQGQNAASMQGGFSWKPGAVTSTGNSQLDAFIGAIGQKESGNNYKAVNKHSGAMGKYQIMPANINGTGRGWDYEVLGRDITTSQFMSSPELQDQIARAKLTEYYNKYGAAGAAIAWYAGPGAANKYKNTGYVSGAAQGAYPSIAKYMQAILGGMR